MRLYVTRRETQSVLFVTWMKTMVQATTIASTLVRTSATISMVMVIVLNAIMDADTAKRIAREMTATYATQQISSTGTIQKI
jgi:hypothetical protein